MQSRGTNHRLSNSPIREQQKKLFALEMELAAAKKEGYVSKYSTLSDFSNKKKKLSCYGNCYPVWSDEEHRCNSKGDALKKLETEKGLVPRFVIGRSLDREIDIESRQTSDFIILDDHIEAPEENPKKTKLFFSRAAETWDAEFYVKLNDDVYVKIDGLAAVLTANLHKLHIYMGCMKSGEIFSDLGHKWYEPEWWRFGDGKSYFRHTSGDIIVSSQELAQFVSINRSILRAYAHDDISVGSWFIGLDVKHIDEARLCCS